MKIQKTSDPGSVRARLSYASPDDPLSKRIVVEAIEWLTGRARLERLYTELKIATPPGALIWEAVLEKLDISVAYDHQQLAKIPAQGPVVVVANHPFGVVDGLILGYLIAQARDSFFVLVNEVLYQEPMLKPFVLPVDFRETKAALHTNLDTRRKAMEHLQQGGAIGIFPAGGVATSPRGFGPARDLDWKRFTARLIQQTRATVVPLYVHGQNSRLFQIASQFSLNLRLSLLLHEVRNKMGREISLTIGDPIPYPALAGIKDRQALLDHLRKVTHALENGSGVLYERSI